MNLPSISPWSELNKILPWLRHDPQVIELLTLLMENREWVVGKEEINETVWCGRVVPDAALDSRIKSLRQFLGDDARNQRFIRTIHK